MEQDSQAADVDDDLWEDPEFEAFYERLWQIALSASDKVWDERRDQIPPPEQSLAKQFELFRDRWTREQQKYALQFARGIGEVNIQRAEEDLAQMRRALAVLEQPRSTLLRSLLGLAPAANSDP